MLVFDCFLRHKEVDQLRGEVGVVAQRMEDVLEMDSNDFDEDSGSDTDSNEEETNSVPR